MSNILVNYRGYTAEELEQDVANGEKEQDRFKEYIDNKYDIKLIGTDRYCSYDFSYANNSNVLIEYKALILKQPNYVDEYGNATYYTEVMIGVDKIDEYLLLYNKNLKKHTLLNFYYVISFNWLKNNMPHRVYYFTYLDLHFIINNVRTEYYRNKLHYFIPFKYFYKLRYFPNMIN